MVNPVPRHPSEFWVQQILEIHHVSFNELAASSWRPTLWIKLQRMKELLVYIGFGLNEDRIPVGVVAFRRQALGELLLTMIPLVYSFTFTTSFLGSNPTSVVV